VPRASVSALSIKRLQYGWEHCVQDKFRIRAWLCIGIVHILVRLGMYYPVHCMYISIVIKVYIYCAMVLVNKITNSCNFHKLSGIIRCLGLCRASDPPFQQGRHIDGTIEVPSPLLSLSVFPYRIQVVKTIKYRFVSLAESKHVVCIVQQ